MKYRIFPGVQTYEAQQLKGCDLNGDKVLQRNSLKQTSSGPRGSVYDYIKERREEEFVSKCQERKRTQTSPICSSNLTKTSEFAKVLKTVLLKTVF